ncbi:MAG: DUF6659 family protein [Nitrosopumilaceae archaeon]
MDLESICKKVMDLDNKIRFVGIINEKGRLVAGGMRKGVEPLENPKQSEILFMELALRVKMRKEFDGQMGPVKFAMSYREKAVIMSFPIRNDNVLYVSTDTKLDFKNISSKILKIFQKEQ